MKNYIFCGQNGVARIDENTDSEVVGIGTSRIATCVGVVLLGEKRLSLMHVDIFTDFQSILDEVSWLDGLKSIVLVKNKKVSDDACQRLQNQDYDVEKRVIFFMREYNLVKCLKRRLNSEVGNVYVSRSGEPTDVGVWNKLSAKVVHPPYREVRDAVNFLNGIYHGFRKADIQFNSQSFSEMAYLMDRPRTLLTLLKRTLPENYDITVIAEKLQYYYEEIKNSGGFVPDTMTYTNNAILMQTKLVLENSVFQNANNVTEHVSVNKI